MNVKYDFSGKTALVVGGGTGIGKATALLRCTGALRGAACVLGRTGGYGGCGSGRGTGTVHCAPECGKNLDGGLRRGCGQRDR